MLGVKSDANEKDIKSAFKKLAKQHHPDSSTGSEEKFKQINEAYEVLKDANQRNKYDYLYGTINKSSSQSQKQRAENYQKSNMYSDIYSDIDSIRDFYNQKEKELRKKQAEERLKKSKVNSQGESFSDFFETFFGKHKERAKKQKEEAKKQEPRKRGDDFEMDIELALEDAFHGCLRKIEINTANSGVRRLEVSIPAGVKNGTKIKIASEGKPGTGGGQSGDLYLSVKLKEHDDYWLDGDDVHSELRIKPYEAVLGGEKRVGTLGDIVELVVPPKSHNGRVLRLRSKGLKNSKGEAVGDHYVHIIIDIGDNLSDEEIMSYKYLRELNERK